MKKSFLVLLSAVILLFTACESWMQDDNFYADIENDVKVANAKQIKVYVSYAMNRQGKTSPDGFTTFKVDIPHSISAATEPEYGFMRWAAFSTSFLATGDNQSQNKDVIYIDEDDYNTRLLPHEIKGAVVFKDPKKANTSVTIKSSRNDIYLVPIVTKRPSVALTIPSIGSKDVVRNMSVRISFSKAMDEESFKNGLGEYDKISITQGTITTTADGDIEIASEDISDLFDEPKFSKNKKMITLQFKEEARSTGYATGATIYITISKEVKDLQGFTMLDDEKVSFTAGSDMDTLAPRVKGLGGGIDESFARFRGMSELSGTNFNAFTNIRGGKTAPTGQTSDSSSNTGVYNSFYNTAQDKIVTNRVKDKVIIYASAEDVAGSGENASAEAVESDVASLSIRAKLLYDVDGNPVTDYYAPMASVGYAAQVNRTSLEGTFKELVNQANANSPESNDKYKLDNKHGCIFEYDMAGLPDGLYRIDVAAVDMIGNTGFGHGGDYDDLYANSYASIYVVKDETAPSISVKPSVTLPPVNYSYYNETTYKGIGLTKDSSNNINDAGLAILRSDHSKLQWLVTPNYSEDWKDTVPETAWKNINENYTVDPADLPSTEGQVALYYAYRDDLGNISNLNTLTNIYYDSTLPVLKENLSWKPETGSVAGVASDSVLNKQTLVIPVEEGISGIKTIELLVSDEEGNLHPTPFGTNASGLTLYVGTSQYSAGTGFELTDSNTKLRFPGSITNFSGTITIKGVNISSAANPAEGEYTVKARITDRAGNVTTTDNIDNTKITLSVDSTKPVIDSISIPDLNYAKRFDGSDEYWVDYNSANLTNKTSTNTPIFKEIYFTFKESNSGANIFDFTDSYITFTSSTEFYRADTDEKLSGTLSGKVFTLNSPIKTGKDASNQALPLTIKVTNVKLWDYRSTYYTDFKLKITDTATNISETKNKVESGSYKDIEKIWYDYQVPSTYTPSLADNKKEGHLSADSSFTNSKYVKATMEFKPTGSGISQLVIDSDSPAVFVKDTAAPENNTTITNSSNSSKIYDFDVSADGKTLTFMQTVSVSGSNVRVPATLGPNSGSSYVTLVIDNLKLTGDDEEKEVKIKAKSLGGLTNTGSSGKITLDETPPAWVGDGVYTKILSGANDSSSVFPHPVTSGKVYGLTVKNSSGEVIKDSRGNPILHFYVKSGKSVGLSPDYVESNPVSYIMKYDGVDGTSYNDYWNDWSCPTSSSILTYEVYLRDRAGNESDVKTIKIIPVANLVTNDASRKDIKKNLENDVMLIPPEGANLNDNTFLNGIRKSEGPRASSTYDYYNGSMSSQIWVYNYVLQKINGKNYQLKVPLSGYAGQDLNTVPIEYYGVSHQYTAFPSTKDECSKDSFIPNAPNWHEYKKNTSEVSDGHLKTKVDENGDIIIILPNDHNCPPVSLWVKDACGNTEYILLNPGLKAKLGRDLSVCTSRPTSDASYGKRNEAVAWVIDGGIGVNTSHNGTGDNEVKTYPSGTTPSTTPSKIDVAFYKKTSGGDIPYLELKALSDNCRFPFKSGEYGVADLDAAPKDYSLKSKIIVWTESGSPAKEQFYDSSVTGSDWYAYRESFDEENNSSIPFLLKNYFPEYDNATHDTGKFKLYYIIEDRVGNYEIRQIIKSSSLTEWVYDATPPKLEVSNPINVNTIDGTNYYSDQSSVEYEIEDKQSGIKNNGNKDYEYEKFDKRTTTYSPDTGYSLSGKQPVNKKLSISGVIDWAGNPADAKGLEIDGKSDWVYQKDPPVLATSCFTVTNISQGDSSTVTATPDNNNATYFTVKAVKECTDIKVTLKVADTTEPLLGWWITSEALKATDFNNMKFITQAQLTANNTAAERTVTYVSTATEKNYTTTFKKRNSQGQPDKNKSWGFKCPGETYFYAVNRAGLINKTPIVMTFEDIPVPAIKEDSNEKPVISYSGVVAYTDPKHSGANKENFTKSGSKVIFEAVNATKYTIKYGSYEVTKTLPTPVSTSGTYKKYEVDLTDGLTSLSGSALKLQLVSDKGEKSDEYVLGVTKDNSGNVKWSDADTAVNKWTYDNTPPTIAVYSTMSDASTDAVQSPYNTSDVTLYFKGQNAIFKFSVTADTEEYKVSTDNTNWTTIDSSKYTEPTETINSTTYHYMEYTFAAPASKTTYYFKAIDKAGNETAADSIPYRKIQRDDQAPDGTITAKVSVDSGSDKYSSLKTKGLIKETAASGTTPATVQITYSSVDTNTDCYINKLDIDLSSIADSASGLYRVYVSVDDGTLYNVANESYYDSNTKHYVIPLTSTLNGKIYQFTAEDNIRQKKTIIKYVLTSDSTSPKLEKTTSHAVQSIGSGEGASAEDAYNSGSKYFLKEGKTILRFNINEKDYTDKYYWLKPGATKYEEIPEGNRSFEGSGDSKVLKVTFDTPTSDKTYKIKAIDGVGNESSEYTYTLVQDNTAPAGNFSYKVLKSDETTEAAGYFTDNSAGTIIYNPNVAKYLDLDFSDIVSKADNSGSGIKNFTVNGSSVSTTSLSNGHYHILLSNMTSYDVLVCDNAGNEKTLVTFGLTADSTAPEFELAASTEQKTSVQEKGSTNTYNIKTFNNIWFMTTRSKAVVNFGGTYEEGVSYQMKQVVLGEETDTESFTGITLDSSHTSYTFSVDSTGKATEYTFRAVDQAGNISTPFSVIIAKDTAAPTGDVAISFNSGATGYYKTTTSDSTVTIEYNPNKVTKIILTPDLSDGTYGSGIKSIIYDGTNTLTNKSAKELDIEDTTWTIKAKDNLGNEATIKTIVLKSYSGVAVTTGTVEPKPAYSGLKWVPTYPNIGAAGNDASNAAYRIEGIKKGSNYSVSPSVNDDNHKITEGDIQVVKYDNGVPNGTTSANGYTIRKLDSGTKFTIPVKKDSIIKNADGKYYLSYALTYNSITEPSNWSENKDVSGGTIEVPIDLDSVNKRHTFIFVWFKDELGIIKVYNLNNPDSDGQNWFTTDASKETPTDGSEFEDFDYGNVNGGANPNISAGIGSFEPAGLAVTTASAAEPAKSRVAQFFSNVFSRESELPAGSEVSQTPAAKKTKKAAKAAKKTARAAAKKAEVKTSQPAVQEMPAAVAAPEAVKVTERAVSEIAAVSEKVIAQAETAVTVEQPAAVTEIAPAAATAPELAEAPEASEKSPVNTAVIVVMIAILSALGGAWYVLKGRKK